mmetsp:Transcript_25424/g.61480  ORF Transcript_25424/g.61480 Transcript_25424/m.61480 type:complete len:119 (+) Transcript_25424:107-463(+)
MDAERFLLSDTTCFQLTAPPKSTRYLSVNDRLSAPHLIKASRIAYTTTKLRPARLSHHPITGSVLIFDSALDGCKVHDVYVRLHNQLGATCNKLVRKAHPVLAIPDKVLVVLRRAISK